MYPRVPRERQSSSFQHLLSQFKEMKETRAGCGVQRSTAHRLPIDVCLTFFSLPVMHAIPQARRAQAASGAGGNGGGIRAEAHIHATLRSRLLLPARQWPTAGLASEDQRAGLIQTFPMQPASELGQSQCGHHHEWRAA